MCLRMVILFGVPVASKRFYRDQDTASSLKLSQKEKQKSDYIILQPNSIVQLKFIMLSILPFETQEINKTYFLLSMFDNYLLILFILCISVIHSSYSNTCYLQILLWTYFIFYFVDNKTLQHQTTELKIVTLFNSVGNLKVLFNFSNFTDYINICIYRKKVT